MLVVMKIATIIVYEIKNIIYWAKWLLITPNRRLQTDTKQAFFCGEGPRSRCYGRTAALRLIVQPCDEEDLIFFGFPCTRAPVEWNWQEKTEVLGEKTCPSATLSTTNPTSPDPGSNPGLRGEKPATNRLSHGRALPSRCNTWSGICHWSKAVTLYYSYTVPYHEVSQTR